jgi:hypothetical protein
VPIPGTGLTSATIFAECWRRHSRSCVVMGAVALVRESGFAGFFMALRHGSAWCGRSRRGRSPDSNRR